jgi:hypothetical protein
MEIRLVEVLRDDPSVVMLAIDLIGKLARREGLCAPCAGSGKNHEGAC